MTDINRLKQDLQEMEGQTRSAYKKKGGFETSDIPSELIMGLSQGTDAAFDQLCLHYSSHLHRFVFGLIHNQEEAKEIVQDTFVDIYMKRESIDFTKNIKGLIYTTAKNKAFSYLRHLMAMKRYNSMPGCRLDDVLPHEELIIKDETRMMIQICISSMEGKRRSIMTMAHNEGLSTKEIAAKLGITERAVQQNIKKALEEIRQFIQIIVFFLTV